jgi:hypothetical protein
MQLCRTSANTVPDSVGTVVQLIKQALSIVMFYCPAVGKQREQNTDASGVACLFFARRVNTRVGAVITQRREATVAVEVLYSCWQELQVALGGVEWHTERRVPLPSNKSAAHQQHPGNQHPQAGHREKSIAAFTRPSRLLPAVCMKP